MAPKSTQMKPDNGKQPPPGISDDAWASTPDSVKKFITSLLKPSTPENNSPALMVLFLNVAVVGGLTYLFTNIIVFPCVTPPYISSLSMVLILVTFVHYLWRYRRIASTVHSSEADLITVNFAGVAIRFNRDIVISILNLSQPWKLSNRILGILLLLFCLSGLFLNLSSYSPFRGSGNPFAIKGFLVDGLEPTPILLAPGQTLKMTVGQTAIVDVALLGDTQVSCTWTISSRNGATPTGCSINYRALTSGDNDILTVFVRPVCGSQNDAASLFIDIQ